MRSIFLVFLLAFQTPHLSVNIDNNELVAVGLVIRAAALVQSSPFNNNGLHKPQFA